MNTSNPDNKLTSLDHARNVPDGTVILEGDGGKRIYLVCPAQAVRCWEPVLLILVRDMDAIASPGTREGARIRYERLQVGASAASDEVEEGDNSPIVNRTLWVHEQFVELGLERAIRGVLRGHIGRIPLRERLRLTMLNSLKQSRPLSPRSSQSPSVRAGKAAEGEK